MIAVTGMFGIPVGEGDLDLTRDFARRFCTASVSEVSSFSEEDSEPDKESSRPKNYMLIPEIYAPRHHHILSTNTPKSASETTFPFDSLDFTLYRCQSERKWDL